MKHIFLSYFTLISVLFAQETTYLSPSFNNNMSARDQVALKPIALEGPIDSTYMVGPGDFFSVVAESQVLTVQVNPEGKILLGNIGLADVSGLPLYVAKEKIIDVLTQRHKKEFCSVSLVQLRSFRVPVLGEVNKSGDVTVRGQVRLNSLILAAGGWTKAADFSRVTLLRNGDSSVIDFVDMVTNGRFEKDIVIQPGDRVYIPRRSIKGDEIYLRGSGGGLFPSRFVEGKDLYFYLESTGFLNNLANTKSVLVKSLDGSEKVVFLAEMKNTEIFSGDIISILDENQVVYVGGAVLKAGPQSYNPAWRPIDYIVAAGSNILTEDLHVVKVIRKDGVESELNTVSGKVLPGDYLEVDKSNFEYVKDWAVIVSTVVTVISTSLLTYHTITK